MESNIWGQNSVETEMPETPERGREARGGEILNNEVAVLSVIQEGGSERFVDRGECPEKSPVLYVLSFFS